MDGLSPLRMMARGVGRQQWIRMGVRGHLARIAESPDRTPGWAFSQPFYGGTYVGHTGNYIDWSTRYFSAYAREELDLFNDILGSSIGTPNVIDVGANVGHHSLYFGLKGADVLAFEPNPSAIDSFNWKIEANPNIKVQVIQKALSDRQGPLALSVPDHCNIGIASFENNVGPSSVLVDVCCGDDSEEVKRLATVDFIKIDVEGHEVFTLAGLRQTLMIHRPPVFFEWNGRGSEFMRCRSLFPDGYSFYRFLGDQVIGCIFAKPGYRLQLLPAHAVPTECNILALPAGPLPPWVIPRLL